MEFSSELALALVQSTEQFPVDFDDAWQWIGYSSKQMARKKLVNNFETGVDFLIKGLKSSSGGRSSELIALTVDCLKSLGMMAGTQKGKEIRRYFLECERLAKKAAEVIPAQSARIRELELELELARATDSAARSQERLIQISQTIVTLHGAGMLGLILGKPEAIVEPPPTVIEKTILVNQSGRPIKTYQGLSKTKLAKRYGMKKAADLVNWLESVGKANLLQSGLTAAPCQYVPFEFVPELDGLWASRLGSRQRLLGE